MSAPDDHRGLSRQQRRQAERDARRGARGAPSSGTGRGSRAPAAPAGRDDDLFHVALRAHADGRTVEAEETYRRLLRDDADRPDVLRFLGLLLDHRSQLADAINGLPVGPGTAPRPGDAAYQTGVALASLGRAADAERALREALAADAQHGPALVLLSEVRRSAGALDEAAALARRAVSATDSWAAHKQLGHALREQERVVEATAALRRATALAPNDAGAWLSLGNVFLAMGEYGEAMAAFERARDLEPQAAAVHNNVAVTALGLGRFAEAAKASALAIEREPSNAQYRYNRAFGLLGSGDLTRGWELFEHGFDAGGRKPNRTFPVPRWDGQPAPDAALLIWREQGVGDEIRLASCYGDAAERVGRVIIETDPRLVTLFARSFPWATVRPQTTGPAEPDFDVQIPVASLPRILRPSLDAFPRHDGYLVPDERQRDRFRARLAELGAGKKVGIAWRSMNLGVGRLGHYSVLDEWEAVARLEGVELVNLQYGVPEQVERELAAFRERTGVTIHRWDDVDYTNDFEAVTALIAELDGVVGVGTTPALVSGALGTPTMMLALPDPLTFGGERYPWLPALRRFPKGWDEPWSGPIEAIAAALHEGSAASKPGLR